MKNKNKTIGIIGGMGPQASAKLLEVLINICTKNFGARSDSEFPEIILNSVAVPDFISDEKNLKTVLNILNKRIKLLEKFNPVCFGIACNTAHLLLKDLQFNTNIPFVSIIDEIVKNIREKKIKKVGLLASPTTIKTGLYQNKLSIVNIELIIPQEKEILVVESVIRNVLAGKIIKEDQRKLILIAESLTQIGAEGIILGCTELPLIFPKKFNLPVFDSIEILARALAKKAYETSSKNAIINL